MLVGFVMCVTHHLLYSPRMSSLRWLVEVGVGVLLCGSVVGGAMCYSIM